MRFGVFLLAAQFPGQDHTTVLDSTVAAAVAAEGAGFDDVWVAEHHFMSYGLPLSDHASGLPAWRHPPDRGRHCGQCAVHPAPDRAG
jgi:alkanesulfonate monooxygenase SsuD/methylene tetrahydromethanopterin reductase-like flavin-dependent oxidoreductase (luciferase family)